VHLLAKLIVVSARGLLTAMSFTPPEFVDLKLYEPERLAETIEEFKGRADLSKFHIIADVAQMMLTSSATNDYLEKIGAESTGGVHSADKLGPDGYLATDGIEVKPRKGTPGSSKGGVINDDTPMKLVKDSKGVKWVVFLNATESGSRVNFAVVAPFHYWNAARFECIVKRLELDKKEDWTWGCTLPTGAEEQARCLEELTVSHKPKTYVRASPLSLEVLQAVPVAERRIWINPKFDRKKLPKCIKELI